MKNKTQRYKVQSEGALHYVVGPGEAVIATLHDPMEAHVYVLNLIDAFWDGLEEGGRARV